MGEFSDNLRRVKPGDPISAEQWNRLVDHASAGHLQRGGFVSGSGAAVRPRNVPAQVIPVTMTQVGGSDGTASAAATWTYDIVDVVTEAVLAEAVNPAAAPHKWKRPYGKMGKATFGYAHMIFDDDEYIPCIGWCNEIPVTSECD